jgi:WD40 repeat protein
MLTQRAVNCRGEGIYCTPKVSYPQITAMKWINKSYEALLMAGSDDGTIKIWHDVANTNTITAHNNYSSNIELVSVFTITI